MVGYYIHIFIYVSSSLDQYTTDEMSMIQALGSSNIQGNI